MASGPSYENCGAGQEGGRLPGTVACGTGQASGSGVTGTAASAARKPPTSVIPPLQSCAFTPVAKTVAPLMVCSSAPLARLNCAISGVPTDSSPVEALQKVVAVGSSAMVPQSASPGML